MPNPTKRQHVCDSERKKSGTGQIKPVPAFTIFLCFLNTACEKLVVPTT